MTNPEIEEISTTNEAFYRFGDFCLDSRRNVLTASGEPVALTYKAIQTLLVLIENQGRIVTKDELLERVWKDTFVEENSLTRNISVLRKVLGESPNSKKFIETVPRRGYRFIAEVVKTAESPFSEKELKQSVFPVESETNQNTASERDNLRNSINVVSPEVRESHKAEQKFAVESTKTFRGGNKYLFGALLLVLIVGGVSAIFLNQPIKNYFSGTNVEKTSVSTTKFTNTGNALDAAISADGKYVVYVVAEGAAQSLWIRQTSDGGSQPIQIVPPAEISFQGIAFAPDGNSIYYNVWDRKGVGEIYRIPVLGGAPVKIVHDCMSSVNVSPSDGKIAFIRGYAKENEQGLLISDANGAAEKLIARFPYDEWITSAAFSPDGKSLAVALGKSNSPEKQFLELQEISLETGTRKLLSEKKWIGVNRISWLPKGDGLIVNGADETQKFNQLWQVALPSGEARKLTSEASGYQGISNITEDGTTLVSVQRNVSFNTWTAPSEHPQETTKITDGRNEGSGANWLPDGRIVFTSLLDTNPNIWIMQADGSGKKQLTSGNSLNYNPVASPDGSIYFVSNRTTRTQIWRMDADGQNLKQITEDYAGWQFSVSPDGKWLFYVRDVSGEQSSLWKMPLSGAGEPQKLSNFNSYMPAVSPDGKFIAYSFWDENANPPQWSREIISAADGKSIKNLTLPPSANIGDGAIQLTWLPDQSGIAYIDFQNKISNVWVKPLDDKKPAYQLTDFKEGRVFQFSFSPDGKKILYVRGNELSDVVLVKIL